MNVLVTGANGFLGSWLTRRLLEDGHQVKALVRKNSDLSELSGCQPEYVYGDVTDKNSLIQTFQNQDVIFHLAGVIAYKKSDRNLMDAVNVHGTQNVIEVCELLAIPKLLYLSSVVAIGSSFTPTVLNETSPYKISDLNLGYFETKKKAEELVLQATAAKKINAICVNPSTIYGFGDAKKGSRKNQIKVARNELKFYTSGGVNVVAVEDVIDGILLALKYGSPGERYILSGDNITIKQLFEKISYFANVAPPKIQIPNWLLHTLGFIGDIAEKNGKPIGLSSENAYTATMFHWFDNNKAKTQLGFKPRSSDIAIQNSVQWMKENGYLK